MAKEGRGGGGDTLKLSAVKRFVREHIPAPQEDFRLCTNSLLLWGP